MTEDLVGKLRTALDTKGHAVNHMINLRLPNNDLDLDALTQRGMQVFLRNRGAIAREAVTSQTFRSPQPEIPESGSVEP